MAKGSETAIAAILGGFARGMQQGIKDRKDKDFEEEKLGLSLAAEERRAKGEAARTALAEQRLGFEKEREARFVKQSGEESKRKEKEFGIKEAELGLKKEELELKKQKDILDKTKENVKEINELRKEVSSLKVTKDLNEVSTSYKKLVQSAASKSPAGDLSVIFSYMKMLDPGSVVRESEFATDAKARSWLSETEDKGVPVPSFVKQAIQKLNTGESLLPEQRKDFVDNANKLVESQIMGFREATRAHREATKERGLPEKQIFPETPSTGKGRAKSMSREEKIKFLEGK